MIVPYIDLPRRVAPIKQELLAAVERVLDAGQYILGPEVAEFERRFATFCATKYAVGVSDGTMALILVLRFLGIGPGDEVITAPNSFIASASCIALVGATPKFVDVRREDMNMNPDLLEAAITPRTKAILPVHLAGQPAEMLAIRGIATEHEIPVIEDAAQSVGSIYMGLRTGGLGVAGCFSLQPLKTLHAIGDGGIITTNDEALYHWLLKARNHGLRTRDEVEFWSTNSRLDTLQAAILLVMLAQWPDWNTRRREIAREYCDRLQDVVGVPREQRRCYHTYQTFMIQAERRSGLLEHLKARGIDAKVHYPLTIPRQQAAKGLGALDEDTPVAHWLAERIVSLPCYPELTREQIDAVIEGVRSFYGR